MIDDDIELIADSAARPLSAGAYFNPNRKIGADFKLRVPGIHDVYFSFNVLTEYIDNEGFAQLGEDYAYAEALFDVSLPTRPGPSPVGLAKDIRPCDLEPDPDAELCIGDGNGGGGDGDGDGDGSGFPWATAQYQVSPDDGPYFTAVGYGRTLSRRDLRRLGLGQTPDALDEIATFFDEVYDIDIFDLGGSSPDGVTGSSPFLALASSLRPFALQEDQNGIPPLDEPTYENGILQTGDISLTTLVDDLVMHYNGQASSLTRGAPTLGDLVQTRRSGEEKVTGEEEVTSADAASHSEEEFGIGVYPNPSAGMVQVRFALVEAASAVLSIHTVNGRLVHRVTVQGQPGENVYRWAGLGLGEGQAKAGTYLVRVEAEGRVASSKLVLL